MAQEEQVNQEQFALTPEEQALVDAKNGGTLTEGDDIKLPSEENNQEPKLYVGKYDSIEKLDEGIKNLGSDLPETVLNGMTPEAKEEYYKTLQTKFNQQKADNKQEETKGLKLDDKPQQEEPQQQEQKISIAELNQELYGAIWDNGGITEAEYAKYEKMGYSSDDVDAMAEMQKSKVDATNNEIISLVGGEENVNQALNWAQQNLSDAEKVELNNALRAGNKLTINGFYQMYLAKSGTQQQQADPRLMGDTKQVSSAKGYSSQEEYLQDVRSPEYKKNKLFREKVDKKLSNSKF